MIVSKLRTLFLFCGLLFFCVSQAQTNLYFINKAKNKIIEVQTGQQLSLKYNGYLGQPEFVKQTVTEITDSFVVLGVNPEILGTTYKKVLSNNPKFIYKKVMLKDIIAFRRITVSRQLLKTTLMVANIFGTGFLLTDLYKRSSFSTLETYGISIGIAIGTSIIINLALPENPKYYLNNGWEITTGYIKPKL